MIQFQSFLSGSSGNCTFLTDGVTSVLVDCGATGRYITECMKRIGADPRDLSAVFVTHEHRDHTSGVGVIARKFGVPVYATAPTWTGMARITGPVPEQNQQLVIPGETIAVGTLAVHPFAIPHDANQPVGYSFFSGGEKFSVATDIGHIYDELMEELAGSGHIIIEANHDVEMLRTGRYPYPLKRRILSDVGHLSNEMCGRLCAMLAKRGTKCFWLGHLSAENNIPKLAANTVAAILSDAGIRPGRDVGLNVLPRYWLPYRE